MGNVHTVNCVLAHQDANNNLTGLMKRTCQRMSFKRTANSGNSSGSDKSSSCSTISPKPQLKTKSSKKRMVLNPMPRCSSFEDVSSILPASKKSLNDPTYMLWKRAFEQQRPKPATEAQNHWLRMRRRVHNMSSAISGHLTPKGFPAFSMKRRHTKKISQKPETKNKIPQPQNENPKGLQLPQHLTTKVTLNGASISTVSAVEKPMKSISSTFEAVTTKPKYTLTPLSLLSKLPQNKQAIIIEQLYRDIKELESRYDDQMESFLM